MKTHCYPTEFPEEKAHEEGHLFCFLLPARKGTKQHGLLRKGTSAFSNQDKPPEALKNPYLNLISAGQPCKVSKESKGTLNLTPGHAHTVCKPKYRFCINKKLLLHASSVIDP